MRHFSSPPLFLRAVLLSLAAGLTLPTLACAQGTTQYWTGITPPPSDGTSIATEQIVSGTWDTTTTNWANDLGSATTFHAFTPANSRIAGFRPRSTGYTVTLSDNISNLRALSISGGNSDGIVTLEAASQQTLHFTHTDSYISIASGRELVIGNGLSFSGNLKQIGGGTQRWSGGATAYNGTYSIEAGTLIISSDASSRLGSSSALVLNGGRLIYNGNSALSASLSLTNGRLSGKGAINTPLTAGAGVILAPGDGVGQQKLTQLTLASSGKLEWEIASWQGTTAGTDFDQIISDHLSITANEATPFTIALKSLSATGTDGALSDFNGSISRQWTLFDSNSITDPALLSRLVIDRQAFMTLNPTATGAFSLTLDDGSIKLVYTVVPEPGSALLLGLGCCFWGWTIARRSLK